MYQSDFYYTKPRNPNTTKADYGHALLVAGSYGRAGCAVLAARAALRMGCGLLTVRLPGRCVDMMQVACPEAMVSVDASATQFSLPPTPLDRYQAIAVGPGIGTSDATQLALIDLLEFAPSGLPMVLDADALNILAIRSDYMAKWPSRRRFPAVFTPHEREYQRLFGSEDPAVVAARCNIFIVKKAHLTRVYSPSGDVYVNSTGNAGMATAGSGDVLTGMLLGLLAQCRRHTPKRLFDCVCKAVWMHGRSGDLAVRHQTESSLIASDIVENIKNI